MTIELNHTIVWSSDQKASAKFFSEILGLPAPTKVARFDVVLTENGVSLDFAEQEGAIAPQHYAFLVSEPEFDAVMERIEARSMDYWADPKRQKPGEINHRFGGRGVYFKGPDGHLLEALTQPYANSESE